MAHCQLVIRPRVTRRRVGWPKPLEEVVPGGVVGAEMRLGGSRALRRVEAGNGRPTVVLEAGYGDTAISWAPILPALAVHTHVVAYDRAGLGASDPAEPSPPTIERRLADLGALISQVGGGPCVLVGHSWGGILAQMLAFEQPDLVAGLVLVDPAHEEMLDSLPDWMRRRSRFVTDHVVEQVPSWLLAVRLLAPMEQRLGLRRGRRLTRDSRVRAAVAAAYAARRATATQLQGIRDERRGIVAGVPCLRQRRAAGVFPDVPVVVLSATRGWPRRVREHWTAIQAALALGVPHGEHVVVSRAGHTIHADRPDLVADAILRVVKQARITALLLAV